MCTVIAVIAPPVIFYGEGGITPVLRDLTVYGSAMGLLDIT